jgi:flagellar biosynthesis/type III secretory pathway M-ring protein FliF/YscJ
MKDNMEMINFYAKIFLCIVAIAGLLFLLYKLRQRREKKILEQEKKENIPVFLRELETKIKEFKPAQHYKEEKLYQAELV